MTQTGLEQEVAMNFIGADDQFPLSGPFGETFQFFAGKGSTNRIVRMAKHEKISWLCGGFVHQIKIHGEPIALKFKSKMGALKIKITRC